MVRALSPLSPSGQNGRMLGKESPSRKSPAKPKPAQMDHPTSPSSENRLPASPLEHDGKSTPRSCPSGSPKKQIALASSKSSPAKLHPSPLKSQPIPSLLPAPNFKSSPEEPTLRANEGLTRAIEIMERDANANLNGDAFVDDGKSIVHEESKLEGMRDLDIDETYLTGFSVVPKAEITERLERGSPLKFSPSSVSVLQQRAASKNDETDLIGFDDTAFSEFSIIPDKDVTERLQRSSRKVSAGVKRPHTGHASAATTPKRRMEKSPERTTDTMRRYDENKTLSPSPTPRARAVPPTGREETTNLMDFTEQMYAWAQHSHMSPNRRQRSPFKHTVADLVSMPSSRQTPSSSRYGILPTTPSSARHVMNLIDFDIPPAPTPRSLPTITARELESVKSSFASQISSLRATLLGKEAEIKSLKEAVGDAERRNGEAAEQLRDLRSIKEGLQQEKDDWEKRSTEMETMIRNVKDEFLEAEREREEFARRLSDSEKHVEEAEAKASEAQHEVAKIKASSASMAANAANSNASTGKSHASQEEIEKAVERVAKELHALYKEKHEHKVAALKKSYEARWQRRVDELARKLDDANKEVETLKSEREVTFSGVVPESLKSTSQNTEEASRLQAEQARELDEQRAKVAGLTEEVGSLRRDNAHLRHQLEQERVEKSDLVAAVEEMLSVSAGNSNGDGDGAVPATPQQRSTSFESFRNSIRASGLKPPSSKTSIANKSESGPARTGSISSTGGHSRSGSYQQSRRGIMGDIERMGRVRGTE